MKEGVDNPSKRILNLNTEVAVLKAKESALTKQPVDQKTQHEEDLATSKASMIK